MEQTERIRSMEAILNEATAAVKALDDALEQFKAVLPQVQQVTAYYESPQWRQDFEDDCTGRLPADLRRGVLSEDAVYDLLTDIRRLLDECRGMKA